MEYPEIKVTVDREKVKSRKGRFRIRIDGIGDTFTTISHGYSNTIEFFLDHNRFRPKVSVNGEQVLETNWMDD